MINKVKIDPDKLEKKINELEEKGILPFFNCHTHIFNFSHVNDGFLKGMIPWYVNLLAVVLLVFIGGLNYGLYCWMGRYEFILWLKVIISSIVFLLSLIYLIFPIVFLLWVSFAKPDLNYLLETKYLRRIINFLAKVIPGNYDFLERFANLIHHSYNTSLGKVKSQETIFNDLQSYYPANTRFGVHSMDMDYMVNCNKPPKKSFFYKQLSNLEKIKRNKAYMNKFFPFIHADPRRLADDKQGYYTILEDYIKSKTFQGIKIYPANGYFPFDRRLKDVYDLALKYNLPISTHCSVGPVYYRGNIQTLQGDGYFENGKFIHPFTKNELLGKNNKEFTPHFTHPLNYYCLMNEAEKLWEYWQKIDEGRGEYSVDDLKNYRNLKFCLVHYGGANEWLKYIKDPWLPKNKNALKIDSTLMHMPGGRWVHEESGKEIKNIESPSWHGIITDMLTKTVYKNRLMFPNLYSDISYNLSEEDILPLLKVRLETNKTLAKKILFGTDFYMVSVVASERKVTMKLRSFIGEENFKQIAVVNPIHCLSSKLTNYDELLM